MWAVAITRPRHEAKVIPHLDRQGLEYFMPQIRVKDHYFNERLEPLFPRYFFCLVGNAWHDLMTTIGISGVIMNGEKPALVPDVVVGELRNRCDAMGIYIPPPPFRYRRGMRVRVKCGPLMGHQGIVQGMRGKERVNVLFTMLGQSARVNIFEGDLALVN